MIKYLAVYTLFLMLIFCASCGQNQTEVKKDNIKSAPKDIVTSTGSNEKYHTKYEYTDSMGKRLIIQNSFPKGRTKYTDPDGEEYFKGIFWTRIINETDNPFELTIDFSGDSYEVPGKYFKILVPPDTMTRDKEDLFGYCLTDLDSFLDNGIHKPS